MTLNRRKQRNRKKQQEVFASPGVDPEVIKRAEERKPVGVFQGKPGGPVEFSGPGAAEERKELKELKTGEGELSPKAEQEAAEKKQSDIKSQEIIDIQEKEKKDKEGKPTDFQTNLAQGIIGGTSTNIGLGGGLIKGAQTQAERLLSPNTALGEVTRIEKGVVAGATGAAVGLSAKVAFAVISTALGFDAANVWLASDNIITSLVFNASALQRNVLQGNVSREDGLVAIEKALTDLNEAEAFIKSRTTFNPLVWLPGRIILLNAKLGRQTLDDTKELLEGL